MLTELLISSCSQESEDKEIIVYRFLIVFDKEQCFLQAPKDPTFPEEMFWSDRYGHNRFSSGDWVVHVPSMERLRRTSSTGMGVKPLVGAGYTPQTNLISTRLQFCKLLEQSIAWIFETLIEDSGLCLLPVSLMALLAFGSSKL